MRPIRLLVVTAVLILSFLHSVGAQERPTVMGVRVASVGEQWQIAIAFTTVPRYSVFTLVGPDRVVIDLDQVEFRFPQESRGGPVQAVRAGLFQPGTSRMVLDLVSPYAIASISEVAESGELMLQLVPQSRAEAIERSGQVVATTRFSGQTAATPAPKPAPPVVIAIDAGHGGVDPGAIGTQGTFEKTVTLAFARALKTRIERSGRFKAVLTREGDRFLKLRDRIAMARKSGAQLFISLHADSHRDRGFRGASVYTLSEDASDAEGAALAARENKSDLIGGVDLTHENEVVASILIDLAQRETKNFSVQFASMALAELGQETRLIRNTHRFAGFAVLKSPDIPSVLVELGYLSNPNDEKQLLSPKFQARLAEAIARAVQDYFNWQAKLQQG
jgi:N-acetylmuramoyl-L-alanine amidase